jgi:hypothetical protein
VVLLVNRHADGPIGFGAGVILDDEGLVLTNLHVVANATSLGALVYDAKRTSYIPQDGGLARYLFENDSQIIETRLVRADPSLDLALVKLDAKTKGQKLGFRDDLPKQGERVMAVGHPGETVWSFTSGVVSSLHQGMIQTDAAINRGNSGGPLIDSEGRVAGVNTSKLLGDMHGIGFARPIGLAKALIDGNAKPVEVDLASPERAVKSCAHAFEMGSERAIDCFDEESIYEYTQEKLRRKVVQLKLTGAAKADFENRVGSITKEEFIRIFRAAMLAQIRGEDPSRVYKETDAKLSKIPMLDGAADAYRKTFLPKQSSQAKVRSALDDDDVIARYKANVDQDVFKRTGLKMDLKNPHAWIDLLKMGIRVEKAREIDPTHAWVAVAGRNLDASEYRYAAFMIKREPRGWLKVSIPTPDQERTRPRLAVAEH